MAMLNKTEVRKVRRYAALPKLGIAAMLVSILFIFWWLLLEMLDDLVFHDDAGVYRIGLFFSLAVVFVYLLFFAWAFLSTRFGLKGRRWSAILQKAGLPPLQQDPNLQHEVFEALREKQMTGVADVSVAFGLAEWMIESAKAVADACGIRLQPVRRKILVLVLAPVLLLGALYVPEFIRATQAYDANRYAAHTAVMAVADALDSAGLSPVYTDPLEVRSRSYYTVSARSSDGRGRVSATITQKGVIREVWYSFSTDPLAGPEQNLADAREILTGLNAALAEGFSGAARGLLAADGLFDAVPFADDAAAVFAEAYLAGGGTESSHGTGKLPDGISVDYSCRGGESILYVTIKAE